MIAIVNINSDGTVDSFDKDSCKIESASGSWDVIPYIVAWRQACYPSRLPEECRCLAAEFYFNIMDRGIVNRMPLPFSHLVKISKQISNLEIPDPTLNTTN